MDIKISVEINYTERVFNTLGDPITLSFSYAAGIPFPNVGDHVETEFSSGEHSLKVIERKFAFGSNSQRIRLLLDLSE